MSKSLEQRTELIIALADKAPKAAIPHIKKAAPYIAKGILAAEAALPYAHAAWTKCEAFYAVLEPYHPEDLLPMLFGLAMCFFGGVFPCLIAAIEAFRMTGYSTISVGCADIVKEIKKVYYESVQDDQKDDDHDGIPDVQQIDGQTLLLRKIQLAAKTIEPDQLNSAVVAVSSSCLGVLATLKLKFARAITLGASIGDVLKKPATRYISPALKKFVPDEYHKWVPLAIDYFVKSIAISIAWTIQRVISAFHSSVRGGHLAGECFINFLHKRGIIKFDAASSNLDEGAGYAIAALGLLFQLRNGFHLPFPFNLLMLPITMLEYALMWVVNS